MARESNPGPNYSMNSINPLWERACSRMRWQIQYQSTWHAAIASTLAPTFKTTSNLNFCTYNILDIMGGSYLNSNVAALGREGRLVMLGFLGGAIAKDVDLLAIMAKRANVTGSFLRSRTREEKAVIAQQLREHVWPVLAAGRCLPMIDQVYSLNEASQAHARMEGGDHIGKIVLRVD
jgi:D-arabinose 1-dehydrogenase-like Zn-dependent alcohol dehydrogenase